MVTYADPGLVAFDAPIVRNTDVANSTAWVEFPLDVRELFGVAGRVPVTATIDGLPYRGSLQRMGGERSLLPVLRETREALGKGAGDVVHVELRLDTAARTVDVPADVAAALAEAGLTDIFEALSYSRRREFVQWIESAKRDATRSTRISSLLRMLVGGERLK
ncbi:YdeI/OmpD-associated family protein [Herbiconiux sp. VKM Ac-2851]|uniref:DUF1905 domain-containing protein n=1 Tax=Herbiconiux sp. VKM Ac-2851 TaxID=2739025 RepID=UPI00156751ED|nr:DUF1905 domain-containing protein [Herbiconiux sp. VKM Ac-2851]